MSGINNVPNNSSKVSSAARLQPAVRANAQAGSDTTQPSLNKDTNAVKAQPHESTLSSLVEKAKAAAKDVGFLEVGGALGKAVASAPSMGEITVGAVLAPVAGVFSVDKEVARDFFEPGSLRQSQVH